MQSCSLQSRLHWDSYPCQFLCLWWATQHSLRRLPVGSQSSGETLSRWGNCTYFIKAGSYSPFCSLVTMCHQEDDPKIDAIHSQINELELEKQMELELVQCWELDGAGSVSWASSITNTSASSANYYNDRNNCGATWWFIHGLSPLLRNLATVCRVTSRISPFIDYLFYWTPTFSAWQGREVKSQQRF